MKRIFLLLFASVFFLSSIGPVTSAQASNKLQIQTAIATASIYYRTLERFKANVEAMSGGQLTVELFPAGAVVGATEIGEAVSNGVVNGGMWWTHWASGRHPAGILFSALPGGGGLGLDEHSVLSWAWEGEGGALLNEYYQKMCKLNVVAFLNMPMGPEPFGWFHQKYTTLEEINKLKFRSPPGVPAEIYREMGMPVVSMPGPEIIPAAQRGVIDAAEWIGPAEDLAMGFHTIWKHYYLQGLHQAISIGDILIHKPWYDKLPANHKAILDTALKAIMADQIMMNISLNAAALRTLTGEHGVILEDTPADYYAAYMKAAKTVLDKYIAQDAFFKKVWDSLYAWAQITVPYTTSAHGLFYNFGRTAMETGVIK
jgi:TRAP-type mannitol/chloroaromatic compound transport system substrate-binding protein